MPMHPHPILDIPEETVRVAREVFPHKNVYMQMRDEFDVFYTDEDFRNLFRLCRQSAEAPWFLALVTLMQFAEELTDRQAADAVHVQALWTTTAANVLRICAWMVGEIPASTPVSLC